MASEGGVLYYANTVKLAGPAKRPKKNELGSHTSVTFDVNELGSHTSTVSGILKNPDIEKSSPKTFKFGNFYRIFHFHKLVKGHVFDFEDVKKDSIS